MRPRLSVLTLLVTVACTVTGCDQCSLRHLLPPAPFLRTFVAVAPTVIPPSHGLRLWVEGDTLPADTGTPVSVWPDMRSTLMSPLTGSQLTASRLNNGTVMTGTMVTDSPRNPLGMRRPVRALRCAPPPAQRCSYAITVTGGGPRVDLLSEVRYAIFAVVKRANARDLNYFIMSGGADCNPRAGGTGCRSHSVLHLGWLEDTKFRFGH